jgi:hypothetical protein
LAVLGKFSAEQTKNGPRKTLSASLFRFVAGEFQPNSMVYVAIPDMMIR